MRLTARHMQSAIASVFIVLGGWALVAPQSVLDIGFRPEFRGGSAVVPLAVACFGSQALISGLFAATAVFTRTTFLAYGVALLPFFGFDWWFTCVHPMLSIGGWLDAIGNLAMLGMCVQGWRLLGAQARCAD